MENIADLSLSALRKTRLSTEIPTALWVENNFVPLSAPYIKDYSILDNGTALSDTSDNRYTPRIKPTIVQYSDGTKIELSITGALTSDSIPNKANATRVEIGKSVTSIGSYAFSGCSRLTSVTIPDSVTSIGSSAFSGCSRLTEVHISDLAAWCGISFGGTDSNPCEYAHRLFLDGEEVTNLVIPDGVTSIGSYAFSGCSGLTSVTIGNGVMSIGSYAFRGCSGLTSVTIPDSVTSIGSSAFRGCSALSSITSLRTTAPTAQSDTFGNSNFTYTGRNTYSTGNNVLRIPQGATGYDTGAWLDPLQNSSKCGFHVKYI